MVIIAIMNFLSGQFTGSKRKRPTEKQTSVPKEPEKNEVKKIKAQDKDKQTQAANKPEEVKSDVLSISEKQDETKEEKHPRGEEVRADGSAGERAVRSRSELTSLCVSVSRRGARSRRRRGRAC